MTVTIGLLGHRASSKVQQDGRLVKSYTNVYLYQTTGSRPTDDTIVTDIGVSPGSPYADDANATAGEADIEHMMTRGGHCKATVTITWATNTPVPNTVSTDPSSCRTLWDIQPNIQQRYITKDKNGKLIVNSLGQPFDGGVPVDARLGQAVAKLKILDADFNKNTVMAHSGKVNSATYLGATAGKLQVDIVATEAVEGGYHFWNVQYSFLYDPLGIQPKVPNVGFYCKDLTTGKKRRIRVADIDTDATDQGYVPEPEALYDAAAELANPAHIQGTVVPYSDRPDGCSFISVDYFETLDFSTLPGL